MRAIKSTIAILLVLFLTFGQFSAFASSESMPTASVEGMLTASVKGMPTASAGIMRTSTIPAEYSIRTGAENKVVWKWEFAGIVTTIFDTLKPGQVWMDKSVVYHGDFEEIELGVFEFLYDGTATKTIYIWGRPFQTQYGDLVLLANNSMVSATASLGEFKLDDVSYPAGVLFTHNPALGTLHFTAEETFITNPEEPLIISYHIYLESRVNWMTNFWYSTVDPSLEVMFEPHASNLYYWTTEEVTFNAFDAPKMSWNAGNGISSGAIVDNELGITISFGSNKSPANQTAASVPWSNVDYRNRYWVQNAQVTTAGINTNYWWHLEWRKGGPYIFTVHGLLTQEVDGVFVPLDVIYEITLGGPGGNESIPGRRTITSEVPFKRTFAEGDITNIFEWTTDGRIITRTPIVAKIMLIDENAESALSVGDLVLKKLFPNPGEDWHHLDWNVDNDTLFTVRLRTVDDKYVMLTKDTLTPNTFHFNGFVDIAEFATTITFSVHTPANIINLPRYMSEEDFNAGISIQYIAYEFFEGFFGSEKLYLAYTLINVRHSLNGGAFSDTPIPFEIITDDYQTVTMLNHFSHGIGFLEIFKLLDGFPADWDVDDDTVFYVRIWDTYAHNYLLFDYGRSFAPDSPFYGTIWCIGNHVVGFTEADPIDRQMDVRMEIPISRSNPVRLSNLWTWGCYEIVEVRRVNADLPQDTSEPHLDTSWVAFWSDPANRIPFFDRDITAQAVWDANRMLLQNRIDNEWEDVQIIMDDVQWETESLFTLHWGVTYSDNNSHICPTPGCVNYGQDMDHNTCLDICPDNQLRFNETIRVFATNRFAFKYGILELFKELCDNASSWGATDTTTFYARVRADDGRYLVFAPEPFEGRDAWRFSGFVEIDDATRSYINYQVLCPVGSADMPNNSRTEIPFSVANPALLIAVPSHPFGGYINFTLYEFFTDGSPHVIGMPLAAGANPDGLVNSLYIIKDSADFELPSEFTVPPQQRRFITVQNIFRPDDRGPPPRPPSRPPHSDEPAHQKDPDDESDEVDETQSRIEHQAYIIGFDDGFVHPQKTTTRAQLATIFFRLITDAQREYFWSQTNPFPDVLLTNWFNNAVSTMTNAGLFTGMPDGTFEPDRAITRAEVAAAMVRFMDGVYGGGSLNGNPTSNDTNINNITSTNSNHIISNHSESSTDGNAQNNVNSSNNNSTNASISGRGSVINTSDNNYDMNTTAKFNDTYGHWAEKYINLAALNGWIRGDFGLGGQFRPDDPITRAETAAMINRIFRRLPEHVGDLLPNMIVWPDNMNPNAWYYLYLQEATNSHFYIRKADGIHESWTELIPPRQWELFERPDSRP